MFLFFIKIRTYTTGYHHRENLYTINGTHRDLVKILQRTIEANTNTILCNVENTLLIAALLSNVPRFRFSHGKVVSTTLDNFWVPQQLEMLIQLKDICEVRYTFWPNVTFLLQNKVLYFSLKIPKNYIGHILFIFCIEEFHQESIASFIHDIRSHYCVRNIKRKFKDTFSPEWFWHHKANGKLKYRDYGINDFKI